MSIDHQDYADARETTEGKVYTVSLALFSRTEVLRKWFNNLSTFTLAGGQVTTPTLDPLATERPCSP